MLTVEDYGKIRRAHRDGMSIRQIARTFQHSRRKIREVLANPEPKPYTRNKPIKLKKLEPFRKIIDQIIKDDQNAPPKQKHTAMQIYRRLKTEHNYSGSYHPIQRYLKKNRSPKKQTFIPLSHPPGQRMEADFGHIYIDLPKGRKQIPVLLCTWAYSNAPFAIAMPTERTEAILEGMVKAFEFFGCVPYEVWWDNPKTVATTILPGRKRKTHERYAAFASHYRFEPLFCMPKQPNEKPRVENRVFDLQRQWATPVPCVQNLDELNVHLKQCCLAQRNRRVTGQQQTVGERFEQDQAHALQLPKQSFDACVCKPAKVDRYQTVRFQNNSYSVPHRYVSKAVTVKAYTNRIQIVVDHQVVAEHSRNYGQHEQVLEPVHYLPSLSRRPAALDHADVYRQWKLPVDFSMLRQKLECHHGSLAGTRQYIRVLNLLLEHPLKRVHEAIQKHLAHARNGIDSEQIRLEVQVLNVGAVAGNSRRSCVNQLQVPVPDLKRFDRLLAPRKDNSYESRRYRFVEAQPQAASAANNHSRVCQVGS